MGRRNDRNEITFSDNMEKFGVTAWLSTVFFLSIASLLDHTVFSKEVSAVISLVFTIPFTVMLLRVPIKET